MLLNIIIYMQRCSAIYRDFAALQGLMRKLLAVRQGTSNTTSLPPTFLKVCVQWEIVPSASMSKVIHCNGDH